mgnify:CR=1 FL=1
MQLEAVAKRNVSQIKYIARDILWKIAPWKNRNLRTFIEEVQPDLIVSILNENLSLGPKAQRRTVDAVCVGR